MSGADLSQPRKYVPPAMKTTRLIVLSPALLLAASVVSIAASAQYRFEGPRNPLVVIEETATDYNIQISLIPVAAFDPPTNDKLSLAKSRGVALMALARHLKVPPASEMAVSGFQITDSHMDGALRVVQASLPRSGVRIALRNEDCLALPVGTNTTQMRYSAPTSSPLLTRAGDYLDSVRELRDVCRELLAQSSSSAITDEVAADLEQTMMDKFAILGKQVDADTLLLTVERDEVRKELQANLAALIQRLRQVLNLSLVRSMTSDEPFASYLKADAMLLQFGGTRAIMLPQTNSAMILSVASTAVKDNSASDRIRMQKVCRNKALAALLSQDKGLQVRYAIKTEDQTVVALREGKEVAASLESTLETTAAAVEGFAKDLPVVGTWYSRDQGLFFLALGRITERCGHQGETEEKK